MFALRLRLRLRPPPPPSLILAADVTVRFPTPDPDTHPYLPLSQQALRLLRALLDSLHQSHVLVWVRRDEVVSTNGEHVARVGSVGGGVGFGAEGVGAGGDEATASASDQSAKGMKDDEVNDSRSYLFFLYMVLGSHPSARAKW